MDDFSHSPHRDRRPDQARMDWSGYTIPRRAGPATVHRPFAWQQDQTLWILDWESGSWVLAELRFDATDCAYQECRRSRYRWQREAAGVLLGRVYGAGDAAAAEAASRLLGWLLEDACQA